MSRALSSPRLGWAVLALAALAAGCSSPAAPDATPRVVSVSRGFQPTQGYGWEMTVSSDLSVVDVNEQVGQPDIQCVARVTAADWSELLAMVDEAHFFDLQDYYTNNPAQPIPYFTRAIRTDGRLKTIYIGQGQPMALVRLDARLNALRQHLQWSARDGSAAAQSFCTNRYWLKDTA